MKIALHTTARTFLEAREYSDTDILQKVCGKWLSQGEKAPSRFSSRHSVQQRESGYEPDQCLASQWLGLNQVLYRTSSSDLRDLRAPLSIQPGTTDALVPDTVRSAGQSSRPHGLNPQALCETSELM